MVLRFLCKGSSDELLTGSDVFRGDYDYLVFYINQVQRQIPDPETVAYWQEQEPVYRVRLHGLDYAWVYRVSKPFPHTCEVEMGHNAVLLGYNLDPSALTTEGVLKVTLYWDADRKPISPETMKLQILSPAEEVWSEPTQTILWPGPTVEAWLGKRAITDVRGLRLLPGTPPGIYRVEATSPGREDPLDLGLVEVPRLPPAAIADLSLSHSQIAYLNGAVKLLGYELTENCTPGGQIRLILYWQALETPDRDYKVFTHVLDEHRMSWLSKTTNQ